MTSNIVEGRGTRRCTSCVSKEKLSNAGANLTIVSIGILSIVYVMVIHAKVLNDLSEHHIGTLLDVNSRATSSIVAMYHDSDLNPIS